ncbi:MULTISPECIES: hypothetical protein [unclassified Gemella]|nr:MULTISPECIES: hypothetical protein [unclassified Gemella]
MYNKEIKTKNRTLKVQVKKTTIKEKIEFSIGLILIAGLIYWFVK